MNIHSMSCRSIVAALCVSASIPLAAAAQSPTPVSQVAPVYSLDLRSSGVEGEVVVSFTITSNGDVINPVVVSTTARVLDKPTLAAVRSWKFEPVMQNGVAVSVKVVQPVAFVIPELHSGASSRLLVSNAHPASPEKNPVGVF
jgi:TonB family protein